MNYLLTFLILLVIPTLCYGLRTFLNSRTKDPADCGVNQEMRKVLGTQFVEAKAHARIIADQWLWVPANQKRVTVMPRKKVQEFRAG